MRKNSLIPEAQRSTGAPLSISPLRKSAVAMAILIAGSMVFQVVEASDAREASFNEAEDVNSFPYSESCQQFELKLPKRPSFPDDDAAWGIAEREPYERRGMELHAQGRWTESNCYLIHALNISSDHAITLIETVGFNYAALGNDTEALKYFEDATAFTWDLDSWLQHKAKPPFDTILSKAAYREYERSLYNYYKAMGLPIPKY